MSTFEIRTAVSADAPAILQLIHELAVYEREPDAVKNTVESITSHLFGEHPAAFCHVATVEDEVVGIAIWFLNYSTWTGTHGIYLEDLFVRPEQRKLGIGKELLTTLARIAVARGYERFEWAVLDWNEPAIGFYTSLGATANDEWTIYRLRGDALKQLGA